MSTRGRGKTRKEKRERPTPSTSLVVLPGGSNWGVSNLFHTHKTPHGVPEPSPQGLRHNALGSFLKLLGSDNVKLFCWFPQALGVEAAFWHYHLGVTSGSPFCLSVCQHLLNQLPVAQTWASLRISWRACSNTDGHPPPDPQVSDSVGLG